MRRRPAARGTPGVLRWQATRPPGVFSLEEGGAKRYLLLAAAAALTVAALLGPAPGRVHPPETPRAANPAVTGGGGSGPAPAGSAAKDRPPVPGLALPERWRFATGGEIVHPPVVRGERVFVASRSDLLAALDLRTGRLLWSYRPQGGHLWNPSLAADEGALYAGVQGGWLLALDQGSGRILWRRRLQGEPRFHPVVAGDTLYLTTTFAGGRMEKNPRGRAAVYALRARDGALLWRTETDNYALREPVLLRERGLLFAGGSFAGRPRADEGEGGWTRVYALDAATGRVRWAREWPDGFVKSMHAFGSVLAYVAYSDVIRGVAVADGAPLWAVHTENWTQGFAAREDRIFFGSANGFLHAVDLRSGRTLWKYDQYGVFNYAVGRPVLDGDTLYYHTTYGEAWALDARTGRLRWWSPTGVETHGAPAAAAGTLFLGGADGVLHAYDLPPSQPPRRGAS